MYYFNVHKDTEMGVCVCVFSACMKSFNNFEREKKKFTLNLMGIESNYIRWRRQKSTHNSNNNTMNGDDDDDD